MIVCGISFVFLSHLIPLTIEKGRGRMGGQIHARQQKEQRKQ